jgi:hypothetical protein
LLPFDQVKHFEGEIIIAGGHLANGSDDQIVGNYGRDRGGKSGRSGYERLGDSGCDCAKSGRAGST